MGMMRGHFRSLVRQTLGYGVGMTISRFAGLVLMPIYTRVLSNADYGVWGLVNTVSTILTLLVFLGLTSSLARYFFDEQDLDAQRRVVGTTFWTIMAWCCLLVLPGLLAAPWLSRLLFGSTSFTPYLRVALLTIPFNALHTIQLQLLRLRFALLRYNLLALGNLLLGAGTSVLLAGPLGYGLWGIFLGILVGYVGTSLVGIWMNRALIGAWSRPLLWPMLAMGLPLVPASLGYWAMNYVDRWFLVRAITPDQLGLYEVANKVTSGIALLTAMFMTAWHPFSYAIEQREGARRTYGKALSYYSFFMLGGGLALGLFAREALMLLTPARFHAAYPAVALLTYGPISYGAYNLIATGANLAKKTVPISITTVLAGLANIALNALLISWLGWGILGAATATALSFALVAVLLYVPAQRLYPIPYQLSRIVRALLIQIALMATLTVMPELEYWPGLGLRLAALLSYPLLLWLAGCFETWEAQLLLRAVRQPRRLLSWIGGSS